MLPELVFDTEREGRKIVKVDFPEQDKFEKLPQRVGPRATSAFLTVQEGCDKFCTFCVVPYTRGAEYSRPIKSIVDEAKKLIDSGAKEITLLGQNLSQPS